MPKYSPLYTLIQKAWSDVRFRGKTDDQVAYETGVHPRVVRRARAACTGKMSRRGRATLINPAEIDWSMPTSDLARKLGVNFQTVSDTREILRIKKPKRKRQPKGLVDATKDRFADVDWGMIDAAIAAEIGVSRQRVHQVRHRLGKPLAVKFNPLDLWFIENKSKIPDMTDNEAVELSGHSRRSVRRHAVKHGLKFKVIPHSRSKQPWHLVNWDLPNIDITRIWAITDPPSGVYGLRVGLTRYQKEKGPPKWDKRFGRPINDPLYAKAIAIETKRASAWLKEKAINKKERHHGLRAAR